MISLLILQIRATGKKNNDKYEECTGFNCYRSYFFCNHLSETSRNK